jgi:hypothetical protein
MNTIEQKRYSDLERLLQHSDAEIIEIHLPAQSRFIFGESYRIYKSGATFRGGRATELVLTEGACCVLCATFHNTSASLKDLELILVAKGVPLDGWEPLTVRTGKMGDFHVQEYVKSHYVTIRH